MNQNQNENETPKRETLASFQARQAAMFTAIHAEVDARVQTEFEESTYSGGGMQEHVSGVTWESLNYNF